MRGLVSGGGRAHAERLCARSRLRPSRHHHTRRLPYGKRRGGVHRQSAVVGDPCTTTNSKSSCASHSGRIKTCTKPSQASRISSPACYRPNRLCPSSECNGQRPRPRPHELNQHPRFSYTFQLLHPGRSLLGDRHLGAGAPRERGGACGPPRAGGESAGGSPDARERRRPILFRSPPARYATGHRSVHPAIVGRIREDRPGPVAAGSDPQARRGPV